MPIIVTTHLLGGMSVLALMTWLAVRENPGPPVSPVTRRWRPWLIGAFLLLTFQIGLGGWVSTNYAALACMDFPQCHGQWIPEMDLHGGFSLFRALGELPSGEMISQAALTAIHWVHRNMAFLVFLVLGSVAWKLRADPILRRPATLVLLLLLAQLITGLTTIFFQWPLLIAVLHNGGAAGLVLCCVTLLVRLSRKSTVPQGIQYDKHRYSGSRLAPAPVSGTD